MPRCCCEESSQWYDICIEDMLLEMIELSGPVTLQEIIERRQLGCPHDIERLLLKLEAEGSVRRVKVGSLEQWESTEESFMVQAIAVIESMWGGFLRFFGRSA